MVEQHDERYYRIECEIRDFGELGRLEERKEDPKSILTVDISMKGKEASNCLINILGGMLDGDPTIAESKATVKYLENAIKEDMKKDKASEKLQLVASARKMGYNRRPSIAIKVYRMG